MLLIFMQKIKFTPAIFLEILQRDYKLIIFGTLGKLGHAHQKQWHQLVENSYVHLQTKNQLDPSMFFYRYYTLQGPTICDWPRTFWEINLEYKFCQTWTFWLFLHLHVEYLFLSSFPCFHRFLSIILSGILTSNSWF